MSTDFHLETALTRSTSSFEDFMRLRRRPKVGCIVAEAWTRVRSSCLLFVACRSLKERGSGVDV
jgi:hypothetical protein